MSVASWLLLGIKAKVVLLFVKDICLSYLKFFKEEGVCIWVFLKAKKFQFQFDNTYL